MKLPLSSFNTIHLINLIKLKIENVLMKTMQKINNRLSIRIKENSYNLNTFRINFKSLLNKSDSKVLLSILVAIYF